MNERSMQSPFGLNKVQFVIGWYDLPIANKSVRHALTLASRNIGEFARVSGLFVKDWLSAMGSP